MRNLFLHVLIFIITFTCGNALAYNNSKINIDELQTLRKDVYINLNKLVVTYMDISEVMEKSNYPKDVIKEYTESVKRVIKIFNKEYRSEIDSYNIDELLDFKNELIQYQNNADKNLIDIKNYSEEFPILRKKLKDLTYELINKSTELQKLTNYISKEELNENISILMNEINNIDKASISSLKRSIGYATDTLSSINKNLNEIKGIQNKINNQCNIKWNISYNNWQRIYHMPWCSHYNDTKIDTRYWERWFCSEQEARAAWWRRCVDF